MLTSRYKAYQAETEAQIIKMAINGSGIRDTARVLGIHKNTVMRLLKKNQPIIASQP
jgi:transposase-like protein